MAGEPPAPPAPGVAEPLSEEGLVGLIAALAGPAPAGLAVGIGDDAAVLDLGGRPWCVTADLLVEGVHFDLAYFSPRDLGHRAMAANLSDLAAMGATPRYGFLSLGVGPHPSREFLAPLLAGLCGLGRAHGLTLAGGDTVASPQVLVNLCLLGDCPAAPPMLRRGGRPGDAVCVTGHLGAARAGLGWLKAGGGPGEPAFAPAVEAHLRPRPRVAAGQALARTGLVSAAMDLSDGLATDLARLAAASRLGAEVRAELLPIAPPTRRLAAELGGDSLAWALGGGEDFELLFTCAPPAVDELARAVAAAEPGLAVTRVGTLLAGEGVALLNPNGSRREIAYEGFDHLRAGGKA